MKISKSLPFILILALIMTMVAACQAETPTSQPTSPPPTSLPTAPPLPTPTTVQISEGSVLLTGDGQEVTLTHFLELGNQARWAVGDRSTGPDMVLYSPDGGLSWADRTPPDSNLDPALNQEAAIGFVDANTGWVIYELSTLVWKTTDAGESWSSYPLDAIENVSDIPLDASSNIGNKLAILNQDSAWVMQEYALAGVPRSGRSTIYRTLNGGESWELMLDPSDFSQSFSDYTITGFEFGAPDYGWIGQDTQGFYMNPPLSVTRDGGSNWEHLPFPPPPDFPKLFSACACATYLPELSGHGVGTFLLSCNCYGKEEYPYTQFEYQTSDDGGSWTIQAVQ